MAASINQRIVLTGADEVRRHLDEIAAAGQRAGNTTRAALVAATSGAQTFTAGTRAAAASSGQMRFALQNLSFQVNDVATSLASGGDVMRVFAQQGGQVFQAFQQGGGFTAVMGAATSAIRGFITPTTAAIAALAALGGGLALLAKRGADAESAAREFDVIMKATGRSGGVTGKQLETAAENLHDVGVSANEAREQFKKFLGEGGTGRDAANVVRIGAELNKVLGEGSLERFVSAAAKGGAPLEEIAKQLGIIVPNAAEAQKALDAAAKSSANFTRSVTDAVVSRNRSIADEERRNTQQILDLTRKRGTAKQELELQSTRAVEEITRQSNRAINDLLVQRNAENAAALAAYNQQITEAAQVAADKQSLILQIGQKVAGSFQGSLTPLQATIVQLSTSWNELLDTLSKSAIIQVLVADINSFVTSIKEAIKFADELAAAIRKIPGIGDLTIPAAFRSDATLGQRIFAAQGGLVRGPGTGTSDSIPAQLSNGEFVLHAAAVRRLGLGFVSALNMGNIMPRAPRRFATGGLVSGGGARTPIILHIGSEVFALEGDAATAQRVIRFSRKKAMLSAGRLPSTA